MMSSVGRILRTFWRARVTWFVPIWILITAAAAVWIFHALRHFGSEDARSESFDIGVRQGVSQRTWTRTDWGATAFLAFLVFSSIAIMLAWEDFTYYDNSMFTLYSLRALNIVPPIWRANGRFFPLGHQEFNIIRHFTPTAFGYHLFPALELVALAALLLAIDDDLSPASRAFLAALGLILPSVVISFGGLIFTERNILLLVAALAYCIKRFDRAASPGWAVGAVLCAQCVLYYKETTFLFLFTFAVARLLLRGLESGTVFGYYTRTLDRRSYLDVWLAGLSLFYLLYYFVVMFPHPNMGYAYQFRLTYPGAFWAYLKLDPLAYLLVVFTAWNCYRITFHRQQPSLLWDSLALGGVAYFFAYLRLSMFASYYLAPVDLIACLYVGRVVILSYGKMRPLLQAVVTAAVVLLVLEQVAFSAFCVFERKNTVRAKAEMARAILARYRRDPSAVANLYFPFSNPTLVMQFGAFLQHIGVPVDAPEVPGSFNASVALVSAAVATQGPCVPYETIQCQPGGHPEHGDLIVVLPDDQASSAEVEPFRQNGVLFAYYSPRPQLPSWIHPYLGFLRSASPHAVTQTFPDRWLDASVTDWK